MMVGDCIFKTHDTKMLTHLRLMWKFGPDNGQVMQATIEERGKPAGSLKLGPELILEGVSNHTKIHCVNCVNCTSERFSFAGLSQTLSSVFSSSVSNFTHFYSATPEKISRFRNLDRSLKKSIISEYRMVVGTTY